MRPENTAESDTTKSCPDTQEVKRRRRPLTSAEKAARQEKRLRDQYGNSLLDPDEPSLHGLNAAAILCALTLLRQAYRKGSGGKPKSIADKVARICTLSADHRGLLLKWLTWAKPRRWVLQEERRSAVVAWSSSRPDNAVVWTAALDGQWRAQIQGVAASQEAEAAPRKPSFTSSHSRETHHPSAPHLPQAGVDLPRSEPIPATRLAEAAGPSLEKNDSAHLSGLSAPSGGESVRTVTSEPPKVPAAPSQSPRVHSLASPAMASDSLPSNARREIFEGKAIIIPEFPTFFFKSGAQKANALLNAIKPGSFNEQAFGSAIEAFVHHKEEIDEFCNRGPQQRKLIEGIFTQIGVKLP